MFEFLQCFGIKVLLLSCSLRDVKTSLKELRTLRSRKKLLLRFETKASKIPGPRYSAKLKQFFIAACSVMFNVPIVYVYFVATRHSSQSFV